MIQRNFEPQIMDNEFRDLDYIPVLKKEILRTIKYMELMNNYNHNKRFKIKYNSTFLN